MDNKENLQIVPEADQALETNTPIQDISTSAPEITTEETVVQTGESVPSVIEDISPDETTTESEISEPVVIEDAGKAEITAETDGELTAEKIIKPLDEINPEPAATEIISTNEPVAEEAKEEMININDFLKDSQPAFEPSAHEEEDDFDAEESAEKHEQEPVYEDEYKTFDLLQLVMAAEELVKSENINQIKNRLTLLKVEFLHKIRAEKEANLQSFLDDGGNKVDYQPEPNPLEDRFNEAFAVYKEKKAAWNEEIERRKLENLEVKKALLEELKQLINSDEPLKKTYDEFLALQERWRQTGMVPKSEINHLWENFHFLVDNFYNKVRMANALKDLDLKKNLEAKIELCEKAESLLLEESINKSFRQLQQLHEDWRSTGPIPNEFKDEIWERFKDASNKINERRKEYFEKLQAEQENNLMAKNALCEKMTELMQKEPQGFKDWQTMTEEVNECMKLWKTLGAATRKENDEVWERFKTLVNNFFNNKQDYFNKIKDEQTHNYNLKVNLCVAAEGLKTSTEWKRTTNEFLKLQDEWKKIGPVPRRLSDKIWKRFRAACDEFFKAKNEYFSNINSIEDENLKKKEEMLERVKNQEFGNNKAENLEIIKSLQREWMEIGHVPFEHKNRLSNDFRNIINAHLDKLKISAVEISAQNYKSRLESIKDSPDSARILFKEKNGLITQINQLKSEINLWENNLGYFANSKQADLLKAEFEKKIQRAKEEVALLEAKLKYLNSTRQG